MQTCSKKDSDRIQQVWIKDITAYLHARNFTVTTEGTVRSNFPYFGNIKAGTVECSPFHDHTRDTLVRTLV